MTMLLDPAPFAGLGISARVCRALSQAGIHDEQHIIEELLAGRLVLYRVPGLWAYDVRKIRVALEALCPGQKFDGNSLKRRKVKVCDCGEPLWRMGRCVEHYRRQMRVWQRSSRKRRGQNVLVPIDSPENLSGARGIARPRPKATHCRSCGADLAVVGRVIGGALCRPCWNIKRLGRPAMSRAEAGSAAARVRWGDHEARHAEIRRLRDQGMTYHGIALVIGMHPKSVAYVLRGRKKRVQAHG